MPMPMPLTPRTSPRAPLPRRLLAGIAGFAMLAALLPALAAAQQAAARQEEGEERSAAPGQAQEAIQAAYQQSRNAETLDQLNEAIQAAAQARELELSQTQAAYVRELLSWLHNRRGERYSQRAAAAQAEGDAAQAGELDAQALADFQQSVELDPERWKALHNRGVSYALSGKYDQAVSDFSRVIELNPAYANAWFNRAEIRYEQGQFAQAIEDYSQALRRRSDDVSAYTNRGHAYFQRGQFNQALSDYNQAVRLQPSNAALHANRGDAYQSLGMWQNAAEDYRRAVNLDRQLGRAYQSIAWLMATCPAARYRDQARALQAAQRAIELDGESWLYLDTLAAAQAAAEQYDSARQTLERALEQAPEEERPALQRRLELYRNGQPYRQPARGEVRQQ